MNSDDMTPEQMSEYIRQVEKSAKINQKEIEEIFLESLTNSLYIAQAVMHKLEQDAPLTHNEILFTKYIIHYGVASLYLKKYPGGIQNEDNGD